MIEARGISKYYGTFKALDDVSFQVAKGEVLGFLGPNGAGKSTTMKVLSTFISASEGTATIDGFDVHAHPEQVRARLGYLPETPPLYGEMTVEDYLRFCGRARGLNGNALTERLKQVIDDVGLVAKLKSPIMQLSKGLRQRTGIAQALIHNPPVLILDEPTSGLDPNQIIEIRNLISRLAADKAIIFSTHILQEAAAVSSRMVIINGGRKVADGTADQLTNLATGTTRIRLVVLGNFAGLAQALKAVPGVQQVEPQSTAEGFSQFAIDVKGAKKVVRDVCVDLSRLVVKCGLPVAEIAPEVFTLEDVFLKLLQKGPRDSQKPDQLRQDFLRDSRDIALQKKAPEGYVEASGSKTEIGLPSGIAKADAKAGPKSNEDTPTDLPRVVSKSTLKPAEDEGGRP